MQYFFFLQHKATSANIVKFNIANWDIVQFPIVEFMLSNSEIIFINVYIFFFLRDIAKQSLTVF